jgi:hypothetical protein
VARPAAFKDLFAGYTDGATGGLKSGLRVEVSKGRTRAQEYRVKNVAGNAALHLVQRRDAIVRLGVRPRYVERMAPFLDQTLLQNTPKAYSAFSIDGWWKAFHSTVLGLPATSEMAPSQ